MSSKLRQEYNKEKQRKDKIVTEAAYAWVEHNIILINEKIDNRQVKRLIGSISKFEEVFGPYKEKLPALGQQLATAEAGLEKVITGRANDKKAGEMLKRLSFLFSSFSGFFSKDLPVLLSSHLFLAPRANPEVRLDVLQPKSGERYNPGAVRDALKHALEPSKDDLKLLRKIYRGNVPLVDSAALSSQLLQMSFHELEGLTKMGAVPMIDIEDQQPEAAPEEAVPPPEEEQAQAPKEGVVPIKEDVNYLNPFSEPASFQQDRNREWQEHLKTQEREHTWNEEDLLKALKASGPVPNDPIAIQKLVNLQYKKGEWRGHGLSIEGVAETLNALDAFNKIDITNGTIVVKESVDRNQKKALILESHKFLLTEINQEKMSQLVNVINQLQDSFDIEGMESVSQALTGTISRARKELAANQWMQGKAAKQLLGFYNMMDNLNQQWPQIQQLFGDGVLQPNDSIDLKKLLTSATQDGVFGKLAKAFKMQTPHAPGLDPQSLVTGIMQATTAENGIQAISALFNKSQGMPKTDTAGEPKLGGQAKPAEPAGATQATTGTQTPDQAQAPTGTQSSAPGGSADEPLDNTSIAKDIIKTAKMKPDQQGTFEALLTTITNNGYRIVKNT